MEIVFLSNFMNHHQKPFCDAMMRLCDNFTFISYSELPSEQKALGYSLYDLPYVLSKTDENINYICDLVLSADVVIFGEKPRELYEERCASGRTTLLFSERLFKRGRWRAYFPPRWIKLHKTYVYKKNLYVLCASAYAAGDYRLLGMPDNRMFKWGYFPQTCKIAYDQLPKSCVGKLQIIWVGRLISWKHPEMAIRVAEYLKQHKVEFILNIIGIGELMEKMKSEIIEKNLTDCVNLVGAMPFEDVRSAMEHSHIAIATSDYQEGWGAVINEEMSSGCAVVACESMGSVPYLIKDGENGMTYRNGDVNDLCKKVYKLSTHRELREYLGRNAYNTLSELWNANIAAERLYELVKNLNQGTEIIYYQDGPLSKG